MMNRVFEFIANHPLLSSAFLVTLGLLIYTEIRRQIRAGKDVTPMEAVRLLNHQDGMFVDIRSPDEYRRGHILNAKHLPLAELPSRLQTLDKYRDKPVIIYCAAGLQAAKACGLLQHAGFKQVYSLSGGLQNWEKSMLPVHTK